MRYVCGKYNIELTSDHKLPEYQRDHPLYDRFLPRLAKHLPADTVVIDVGANVGDTYASMKSENPNLCFHCIEPDPAFYNLLCQNMENIKALSAHSSSGDIAVRAYVGNGIPVAGTLVSRHGSAKVIQGDDSKKMLDFIRLDDYLSEKKILFRETSPLLVKSDVDGFDFNVISSLSDRLDDAGLILYFESQATDRMQLDGFLGLVKDLGKRGHQFSVFDNFGNLIHQTCDATIIQALLHYIWRQHEGKATRTMWYLDILASKKETRPLLESALRDYIS